MPIGTGEHMWKGTWSNSARVMRGAPSGRFIYKGVAWGIFASPLANCLVLPPWLIHLSTLPKVHTEPQPDGLQHEGVWGGGEWQDYSLAFPASRPRGAFLPISRLSLAPGRGMCDLLLCSSNRV